MTAAVVTGSASGLGLEVARRMVSRGWSVFGLDVDEHGLRAASQKLGDPYTGMRCDVTDDVEVAQVLALIGKADTAVTGLVNAAGIGGEPGDVTMTPPQQ